MGAPYRCSDARSAALTRAQVLIVSFSTIESDARVLKQVARLSRDMDVHTVGYGKTPPGAISHVRIPDDLPIWRYDRAAVLMRRFRKAYWSNRAIAFAADALDGTRWDAVLANDADAVGLALAQNPAHGVHADLHEYAPRQKEDVRRWRLFVAPFVRWMCREFVVRADSVSTVGQGIADEYRREYGIKPSVVTNAAPYAELTPTSVTAPIRLVHSGAALRDRNILAILEAVDASRADVTLDLYLTPNDPGFLEQVRERAARSSRISLHDPVPYRRLSEVLNAYDVGIHVLPPVNFNNRWALPNKFFDYVQARLGLVIGPSPEMARVLDEYGFGVVSDGFSEGHLVAALDRLTTEEVEAWKRASDAASAELSGERQSEKWADAIRDLLRVPVRRGTA